MNYIDQHMHTIQSPDAYPNASIKNYIKQAKSHGQKALMLTDHVDIDSPVPMFFSYPNYDEYFKKVDQIAKEESFPIYTGVEIGYQANSKEKIKNFVQQHAFDLVICSIHVADGLDFYYGDFFTGKTIEESIKRYFEIVLDAVKNFQDYDIFGHIDYITRYIKEVNTYDFTKYQAILKEILQTIIRNKKGIELNTSKGTNQSFPSFELLKLYKDLGGQYLTIGSDAHTPDKLRQNFEHALIKAKNAGFTEVYTYRNRQAYPVSIDSLLGG